MTANQLKYWELQELKRSNQAKEAETQRSNLTNEHIKQQSIAVDAAKLDLEEAKLEEVKDHNDAVEAQGWVKAGLDSVVGLIRLM